MTAYRFRQALLLLPLTLAGVVHAQSVTASGGYLLGDHGLPIADGNTVLLVVATGGGGFGAVQAGSSLTAGSFINSNDQIIGSSFSFNDGNSSGGFSVSTDGAFTLGTGTYSLVASGQPVELIWFANNSGSTAESGDGYGTFTTTNPQDGSDPWLIPPTGSNDLLFLTTGSAGGSYDPSQATANEMVMGAVPEPSTWGLIAGALALAYAAARTRSSSRGGELRSAVR